MADDQQADNWGDYVTQTARLLNLPIPEEIRSGVVENFEPIVAIAQPVLDFPLTDTDEPAPIFRP